MGAGLGEGTYISRRLPGADSGQENRKASDGPWPMAHLTYSHSTTQNSRYCIVEVMKPTEEFSLKYSRTHEFPSEMVICFVVACSYAFVTGDHVCFCSIA
jgi:hypothetical protein